MGEVVHHNFGRFERQFAREGWRPIREIIEVLGDKLENDGHFDLKMRCGKVVRAHWFSIETKMGPTKAFWRKESRSPIALYEPTHFKIISVLEKSARG
jgi:hypothetical protein